MMNMMSSSRTEVRAHWPDAIRITQLEADADQFAIALDRIDTKLNRILWVAIGALISFTTSAIVLAYTIATR